MQTVAAQSNLTIKGFKPAPTVTKQLHAEWPITLELEGTYHNLAIFFDRVGKFTRIVNISGLDVKGKDKPDAERDHHRDLRRDDVRAARQAGAARKPGAPSRRAAAGEGRLMRCAHVCVVAVVLAARCRGAVAAQRAAPPAQAGRRRSRPQRRRGAAPRRRAARRRRRRRPTRISADGRRDPFLNLARHRAASRELTSRRGEGRRA